MKDVINLPARLGQRLNLVEREHAFGIAKGLVGIGMDFHKETVDPVLPFAQRGACHNAAFVLEE